MIVTTSSQPGSAKATVIGQRGGKAPYLGYAYEGFKHTSKALGFYQDIKPYLPETQLDKYRYKPHKRVAGYLGKTFHARKKFQSRHATCNKFNQKYSPCY